jgi:hypothetical protein
MDRVLAVLVNYGSDQIKYLQQVVSELKSFNKYDVTVVVNSNIPLHAVEGIDQVNIIKIDNTQLLPMTCRQVINNNSEKFDYFIFSENDHLWKEVHVDRFIEYTKVLPENRIAGLIQYEANDTGRYYPAYHAHYDWDYNSVEEYGGKKFAHFTNVHQASFIISKEQLAKIKETKDFNQFFSNDHYSVKCKTNTDIYQYCDMKKLICISDFEDNLIHHLPNVYIDGADGYVLEDGSIGRRAKQRSEESRMQEALKKLL